jgi:hypothetical protein
MSLLISLLKWVVYVVAGLAVVAGLFVFGARFADGPYGLLPGGEFASGEQHQGPEPDWSFVKDRQEVEFQLLDPQRSRTTWIVEHAGRIYIPCGYMNSTWGRIWKKWPIEAEKDGRAVLRVDGVLYDRQLVRIKEGEQLPILLGELGRKYLDGDAELSAEQQAAALSGGEQQIADGSLWIFELTPRT